MNWLSKLCIKGPLKSVVTGSPRLMRPGVATIHCEKSEKICIVAVEGHYVYFYHLNWLGRLLYDYL